jgi:hypothetical protein
MKSGQGIEGFDVQNMKRGVMGTICGAGIANEMCLNNAGVSLGNKQRTV